MKPFLCVSLYHYVLLLRITFISWCYISLFNFRFYVDDEVYKYIYTKTGCVCVVLPCDVIYHKNMYKFYLHMLQVCPVLYN